ncbi:nitrilase and fragile histidine triad fusion protein NitFhit isoform X2 [Leguminivora glycinivorella]|uniref:nitrilase and fragile histidine triad fusion protein NitFhit isoform X2 n=1 Tax=Leguminivora glycinivorella TaxID=1035111 RepID=UPI00200DEE3F|nr:nitrilase and fragile histidine triad fusion protein NitFhit isoform X2 [Leguminivora glycinivorella]
MCGCLWEGCMNRYTETETIVGGSTVDRYRQLAVKHNVWLSMGGLHEQNKEDPTKIYNTHIIINNTGDIVQQYRKLHLFDVEIPERNVRLKESDFCSPGQHIVAPVETPVGSIGMAICYDMRFPELSTALTVLRAQLLTFPSAFTQATGEAHWHTLLRARAIENQCYVIAAAQVGAHNTKRRSYGHALCVDPWGRVLADCGEDTGFQVAEIDLDALDDVRGNMPVFSHRRKDVYSLYALSLRTAGLQPPSPSPAPRTPPPAGPSRQFGHVSVPETCVFYTSELSYAFVNLRCVTPGHVLVAPKRCAERQEDLTDEEAQDFYSTIRRVQKLMEKVHNTESCTVTIQDGPDAGQTVKHLHCHIMPRKRGDFIQNDLIYLELAKHDQFSSTHPAKPPRSLQEMETEAASLREFLLTFDAN